MCGVIAGTHRYTQEVERHLIGSEQLGNQLLARLISQRGEHETSSVGRRCANAQVRSGSACPC